MNKIRRCNIKVDGLFKQSCKVNGMVYIRCKMGIARYIFVILLVKSASNISFKCGKVFLLFFSYHHYNLKSISYLILLLIIVLTFRGFTL